MRNAYSPLKVFHHQDRILKMKLGRQVVPVQVQLIISDFCNQDCSWCFPPETLVLHEDGYIPIEDVEEGMRIFDGSGNLQYVKNSFSRKHVGKLLKFKIARLGLDFRLTGEHPVWIKRGEYTGDVAAKNVKPGDFVRVPVLKTPEVSTISVDWLLDNVQHNEGDARYQKAKTSIPNIILLNKYFGELCGYYLSEGHCSFITNRPNSGNVTWTFSNEEYEYVKRVEYLVENIFELPTKQNIIKSTHQVQVGSRIVTDLFAVLFGSGSRLKQINPALWGAPKEFLEGLWKGYLNGDGCLNDKSLSTTSLGLALGLLNLAYRSGLSPNLYSGMQGESEIEGRIIKPKGLSYTIRFRGKDRSYYSRIVGETPENKRLVNWKELPRHGSDPLFQIKTVEEEDYDGLVYNLSVENSETYIANSIAVHNCAYRMSGYTSNQLFSIIEEDGTVNNNPKRMIPYEKVIEILDDCVEMGVKAIQVTGGGEPTVHPQHSEIFQAIVERNLDLAVVTNGAVLRDNAVSWMLNAKWLRISVDAGSDETYSTTRRVNHGVYGRIWENISKITSLKKDLGQGDPIVGVGFVVSKDNWKEVMECARMTKEVGADNIRLSALFQSEDEKYFEGFFADAAELCREAQRTYQDKTFKVFNNFGDRLSDLTQHSPDYEFCGYQELNSYIGADLNVYRCCTTAYNHQGMLGSIENMRFKDFWESEQKKDKIGNFDARSCERCMFNSKNAAILYAIDEEPDHVNFV